MFHHSSIYIIAQSKVQNDCNYILQFLKIYGYKLMNDILCAPTIVSNYEILVVLLIMKVFLNNGIKIYF